MNGHQRKRDMAAIEALHQRDLTASFARDGATLLSLWSEDPAALPPQGPILRGREPLARELLATVDSDDVWEVVEYVQDFVEVEVVGDYGWDLGTYRTRGRNRETGEETSASGKLLRILRRAPDGSWNVHRSIWNVE